MEQSDAMTQSNVSPVIFIHGWVLLARLRKNQFDGVKSRANRGARKGSLNLRPVPCAEISALCALSANFSIPRERPMISASDKLLFGTAGVPQTSASRSTLSGIQQIAKLGLDCLEIEFVKGVKTGSDLAKKIKQEAQALDIRLSAHAPYFVNLNSPEEGMRLMSQERLLNSARKAWKCGASCLVFHPGYKGGNGAVIRTLVARKRHKRNIFCTGTFDLTRRYQPP